MRPECPPAATRLSVCAGLGVYVARFCAAHGPQGPTEPRKGLTLGAVYLVEANPMDEGGESGVVAQWIKEGMYFEELQNV